MKNGMKQAELTSVQRRILKLSEGISSFSMDDAKTATDGICDILSSEVSNEVLEASRKGEVPQVDARDMALSRLFWGCHLDSEQLPFEAYWDLAAQKISVMRQLILSGRTDWREFPPAAELLLRYDERYRKLRDDPRYEEFFSPWSGGN